MSSTTQLLLDTVAATWMLFKFTSAMMLLFGPSSMRTIRGQLIVLGRGCSTLASLFMSVLIAAKPKVDSSPGRSGRIRQGRASSTAATPAAPKPSSPRWQIVAAAPPCALYPAVAAAPRPQAAMALPPVSDVYMSRSASSGMELSTSSQAPSSLAAWRHMEGDDKSPKKSGSKAGSPQPGRRLSRRSDSDISLPGEDQHPQVSLGQGGRAHPAAAAHDSQRPTSSFPGTPPPDFLHLPAPADAQPQPLCRSALIWPEQLHEEQHQAVSIQTDQDCVSHSSVCMVGPFFNDSQRSDAAASSSTKERGGAAASSASVGQSHTSHEAPGPANTVEAINWTFVAHSAATAAAAATPASTAPLDAALGDTPSDSAASSLSFAANLTPNTSPRHSPQSLGFVTRRRGGGIVQGDEADSSLVFGPSDTWEQQQPTARALPMTRGRDNEAAQQQQDDYVSWEDIRRMSEGAGGSSVQLDQLQQALALDAASQLMSVSSLDCCSPSLSSCFDDAGGDMTATELGVEVAVADPCEPHPSRVLCARVSVEDVNTALPLVAHTALGDGLQGRESEPAAAGMHMMPPASPGVIRGLGSCGRIVGNNAGDAAVAIKMWSVASHPQAPPASPIPRSPASGPASCGLTLFAPRPSPAVGVCKPTAVLPAATSAVSGNMPRCLSSQQLLSPGGRGAVPSNTRSVSESGGGGVSRPAGTAAVPSNPYILRNRSSLDARYVDIFHPKGLDSKTRQYASPARAAAVHIPLSVLPATQPTLFEHSGGCDEAGSLERMPAAVRCTGSSAQDTASDHPCPEAGPAAPTSPAPASAAAAIRTGGLFGYVPASQLASKLAAEARSSAGLCSVGVPGPGPEVLAVVEGLGEEERKARWAAAAAWAKAPPPTTAVVRPAGLRSRVGAASGRLEV